MSTDFLLQIMLLVPLLGAVGILWTRRHRNLRETVTLVTGGLLFLVVAALAAKISWDAPPSLVLAEPLPGLKLALAVEPLGLIFALVASFLWPVTSLYAIGYMRAHHEQHLTRFFTAFALSICATLGIAMSANMLTLFVFYELLTLATFPLVTHAGTEAAKRSGRIYLGILMGTSLAFMLLAIIWTWTLTGTLDFTKGGIFPPEVSDKVVGILLLLFVFGTGKAALMPFHRWLPAAMVAPTPVSALLHAVAVVKAGVFTVMKVSVYLFGLERMSNLFSAEVLAHIAGYTILAASIVAMTKDNLKARLAYSTISQLGYIVLGAMLGSSAGVVGGSMHIAMHAFGKITLFFCAGAFMVAAHKTKVSELDGLGRRMPWTMLAFAIGALSIVGLPPTGGTWSKWMLVQGTFDSGAWVLMAVLLASSIMNIYYLLIIPARGFFSRSAEPDSDPRVQEAPPACLLAIAITASGCMALFFFSNPLYRLAEEILH
jgi:multicomponent Na+:H+ antiporter subunit D